MRKRTRRKYWNPALNPVKQATAARLFDGDTVNMALAELLTIDELKAGQMTSNGLHVLRCMSSISLRLAEDGFGPEAAQACHALNRLLPTALSDGHVSEALIHAAREVHEYHQAQRELCDPASYAKAAAPYTRLKN